MKFLVAVYTQNALYIYRTTINGISLYHVLLQSRQTHAVHGCSEVKLVDVSIERPAFDQVLSFIEQLSSMMSS